MVSSSEDHRSIEWYLFEHPKPHIGKTSLLQKGLICSQDGGSADLCEEGLGFGVPVLQLKRDFVFPGTSSVTQDGQITTKMAWKEFEYNLIERHQHAESSSLQTFSWVAQRIFNRIYKSRIGREFLAVIRPLRIKKRINQETGSMFVRIPTIGRSRTIYELDYQHDRVRVRIDLSQVDNEGLQHVYIHNELGGGVFDSYLDARGVHLVNSQISGWDEIHAEWAGFYSSKLGYGFLVNIPEGIRAYRGREIIGHDIRWSGIIFMLPVDIKELNYDIRFLKSIKSLRRGTL
ncbi:MAG: hypothetical protein ACFFEF_19660 [Candidatus Thorarchaeota archaeon]